MHFKLGVERGFGTFPLKGNELATALITALDVGYRAIDTAQMYGNEKDIGDVLNSSRIPRGELFITSKVPIDKFSESEFIPSVQQSLTDLQTDYVDLLLLHWPPADGNIAPSIAWLVEAKQKGYTKHIGVSNYTSSMLKTAISLTDEPLVCNQVEFHPLLDQTTLYRAASELGVALSSYCSVARGQALSHPVITSLAQKYGRTPGQIVLKWILQKGVSINTMSTNPDNISANFTILDFNLDHPDMALIDKIGQQNMRIVDKSLVPWAPNWDT